MAFLPKDYKTTAIRKSKFFITTKIHAGKTAKCPRCGREHTLEEGDFVNHKVHWKYVTCRDSRTYLILP